MYKNNSRDSSKFNGYSPIQLLCNLTEKCTAVGYYSYTNRWLQQNRITTQRFLQFRCQLIKLNGTD